MLIIAAEPWAPGDWLKIPWSWAERLHLENCSAEAAAGRADTTRAAGRPPSHKGQPAQDARSLGFCQDGLSTQAQTKCHFQLLCLRDFQSCAAEPSVCSTILTARLCWLLSQ